MDSARLGGNDKGRNDEMKAWASAGRAAARVFGIGMAVAAIGAVYGITIVLWLRG